MTSNKDLVSEQISKLVKAIHTDNPHKKLVPLAAAIELLRILQQVDKKAVAELAGFYARVADVPWEKLQFSFTRAVIQNRDTLLEKYAQESRDPSEVTPVMLKAIAVFSDILFENPDEATIGVFDAVVSEISDTYKPPADTSAPAIFQPGMIEKVFKLTPVNDEKLASMKMRHVVFTGHHGVRAQGLLHENDSSNWIILDSGEVLYDIDIGRTAPEASEKVSPLLACYFSYFMSWLTLGSLTVEPEIIVVNLKALVDVFDMTHEAVRIGATGPTGAMVRFPIQDMEIVFTAAEAAHGPYATAKLVKDDKVLMRLDHPRENTPLGVYLFPLPDRVIVVRGVDNDD